MVCALDIAASCGAGYGYRSGLRCPENGLCYLGYSACREYHTRTAPAVEKILSLKRELTGSRGCVDADN